MKEKKKLIIIKIKNFYATKDIIKKMKRRAIDLEKTMAKHLSDKGLLPRIRTVTIQQWNDKQPNLKWAQVLKSRRVYKHRWPISTGRSAQHHCHQGKANQNHKEELLGQQTCGEVWGEFRVQRSSAPLPSGHNEPVL